MFKEGKIFGKINIIDFSVIVLIILLILTAYLKFGVLGKTNKVDESAKIIYDFKIPAVRMYTIDSVRIGDDVYDSQTSNYIGKVIDVKYTKAIQSIPKEDGTIVVTEMLDKYDMTITIETNGVENDKGYFANGNIELKVGGDIMIETKYAKSKGTIFRIETKD
jgi:hypothetical protein